MTAPVDWDEDVPDDDPSVTDWREATGQSTSAQLQAARAETDRVVDVLIKMRTEREGLRAELAKTQAALAASQSDLTQREKERDLAADLAADLFNDVEQLENERDRLKENERRWASEVEYAERERDEARAALARARKELEQLRAEPGWQTGRST